MNFSRTILALLLLLLSRTSALGAQSSALDLDKVLETSDSALSQVDSDERAAQLFERQLRQTLGLVLPPGEGTRTHGQRAAPPPPSAPPPEFLDAGRQLTTELAAWRLARSLKDAANAADERAITSLLENSAKQRAWLTADGHRRALTDASRVAEAVTLFSEGNEEQASVPADYVRYLETAVPRLAGERSWLEIGRNEGAAGIQRQLMAYWESSDATSDADKTTTASAYFYSRLKPVFLAQTYAMATTAEVQAQQRARELWTSLRSWPERLREARAAARLCGTWNWTIHNHQNHLDHKSVMVFPPANGQSVAGGPAKMIVLGDVVYLRWEFSGGVQEDSLLFTGEGQRLEGSFVNSSGAWGSITGKRVAPCPR